MKNETDKQRSKRIIKSLKEKFPGKDSFDLDGRGLHFVCEVEPTKCHPEYDKAVEVIIDSKPHKHLKMIQQYKILSGNLELHIADKVVHLTEGDEYTLEPGIVHWATSEDECWLEIYSTPGWTKEDHIVINSSS